MTINIIWTYGLIIGAILLPIVVLPDILRTRRSPAATMAWALGVVLLPFVAVPLYFLLAGRTLPQRFQRRKQRLDLPRDAVVPEEETNDIDRLLRKLGLPGATTGNSIVWQNDGCSAYTALLDVIDSAKRRLYLVQSASTALAYPVSVGREGFASHAERGPAQAANDDGPA